MVLLALLGVVLVLVAVGCGRRVVGTRARSMFSATRISRRIRSFSCVQMERWKTEVEKRTGGRVQIKTYPGGTLLGAKEHL
jgi:TRAP-type C4-dicarboxylate transport system substrate-binding protein